MSQAVIMMSEVCVRDKQRDAITNNEKLASLILLVCYIPLLFMTVKNLVRYYDKERQKVYSFLPTMNILLFTCVYSILVSSARIAVYLDGLGVITRIFGQKWEEPSSYIYKRINTLWFFTATSFSIMNITWIYIASMLSHLLCAFIVIKQKHLILRSLISGAAIIINIYQIVVAVVV